MNLLAQLYHNSPLTKSAWPDSVGPGREQQVRHGAGTARGSAMGTAGDLGGDAALARPRVLRPAPGRTAQRRVRRLRRGPVRALLRGAAGPAFAATWAVLPYAAGRLLRGDRQRARAGVALRRQPVPARVPPPRRAGGGARPLLAEPHPRPPAARGA